MSGSAKKTIQKPRVHSRVLTTEQARKLEQNIREDIKTPSAVKNVVKQVLPEPVLTEEEEEEAEKRKRREMRDALLKIQNFHVEKKQMYQTVAEKRREEEKLKEEVSQWMAENLEEDKPMTLGNHVIRKCTVPAKYKIFPNDVLLIVRRLYGEKKLTAVITELDRIRTERHGGQFELKFTSVKPK